MHTTARRTSISTLIAAVFALNGFLNLATGLLPIFRLAPYLRLEQVPEYLRVTAGQKISGVISVFLGVLMVGVGRGLYRRRRRAWWAALALLAVLVANNLLRGTTPLTSIVSIALLAGLLVCQRWFSASSDMRLGYGQVIALISVIFAVGYGVLGSYLMRAQFDGIKSWTDAIYYTLVTYSTLGYGDVLPQTLDAKLFVVSMIIVGLGSFITAITMVIGPLIERQMRGVLGIMGRFRMLHNHAIVCGYSNAGESVIDELRAQNVPYIVVEERKDVAAYLGSKGHNVLSGDATRTETLEEAGLRNALAVIATSDSDSINTLVTATAKEFRDEAKRASFRIVARAEDEENLEKVRRVGADDVVSPSTIGGRLMARKALQAHQQPKETPLAQQESLDSSSRDESGML